jgi:hypothetical protein
MSFILPPKYAINELFGRLALFFIYLYKRTFALKNILFYSRSLIEMQLLFVRLLGSGDAVIYGRKY